MTSQLTNKLAFSPVSTADCKDSGVSVKWAVSPEKDISDVMKMQIFIGHLQ